MQKVGAQRFPRTSNFSIRDRWMLMLIAISAFKKTLTVSILQKRRATTMQTTIRRWSIRQDFVPQLFHLRGLASAPQERQLIHRPNQDGHSSALQSSPNRIRRTQSDEEHSGSSRGRSKEFNPNHRLGTNLELHQLPKAPKKLENVSLHISRSCPALTLCSIFYQNIDTSDESVPRLE